MFGKSPIKKFQRKMRYSAVVAIEYFKADGNQRTPRVEEYMQQARYYASKVLDIDLDNEEAKQYINFPDSMADHLAE